MNTGATRSNMFQAVQELMSSHDFGSSGSGQVIREGLLARCPWWRAFSAFFGVCSGPVQVGSLFSAFVSALFSKFFRGQIPSFREVVAGAFFSELFLSFGVPCC